MINFDEEIKKFKPSLEVGNTEEAIMTEHGNDMVDLMLELMSEYRDNH